MTDERLLEIIKELKNDIFLRDGKVLEFNLVGQDEELVFEFLDYLFDTK